MTDVPIGFLDDVIQYLEEDIIEDLTDDDKLFRGCRALTYSESMLQVKGLSYIKRGEEGNLVYFDRELSKSAIVYNFHCISDTDSWQPWGDLLSSFWARLNVGPAPPYVLKWESVSEHGKIKADERYDDVEYLVEDISARDALTWVTKKLAHEYLPRREEVFNRDEIHPEKIKTLYERETPRVSSL